MDSIEVKKVRKDVLILAALLIVLAALVFTRLEMMTTLSAVFLLLSFAFMCIHWFLLSSFTRSLFSKENFMVIVWGMLLILPIALSLALIFIAGRMDRTLIFPTITGIAVIPVAASLYSLVWGVKGVVHG